MELKITLDKLEKIMDPILQAIERLNERVKTLEKEPKRNDGTNITSNRKTWRKG